ncbi:hypothetical protein MKEN_00211800 [Mycena kentingensis (nom. inval.)]|nr:hypothetical protein MKEN_00211800 [Mycena kentingensis (nom. inval.)]
MLALPWTRQPRVLRILRVARHLATHTSAKFKVVTLDPKKLRPNDYLDISSSLEIFLRTITYLPHAGHSFTPFPPNTRGFFYFQRPADALPDALAGGVRFRRVPRPNASFASGNDLLLPDGSLWEVPLTKVVTRSPAWTQLLLDDGLIAPALVEVAHKLAQGLSRVNFPRTYLHAFGQPFEGPFGPDQNLTIVRAGEARTLRMRSPFMQKRDGVHFCPYRGRALMRFELSDDPKYSERPNRRAVLRILKLLQPISWNVLEKYDGRIVPPMEGELVRRHSSLFARADDATIKAYQKYVGGFADGGQPKKFQPKMKVEPWMAPIDSRFWAPLGALLDHELQYRAQIGAEKTGA